MRLSSRTPQSYRRLRAGGSLTATEVEWRIMVSEGHSPEHVSLFSEQLGILICGDQLLPRISANVGVQPAEPEADPLRGWMDALERIGDLPADTLVLPAHGLPYRGLRIRARELLAHHRQQLNTLHDLCAQHPGSVFELMQSLFPRRRSPIDDFLAAGECLAHLSRLRAQGSVRRESRQDGVMYFAANADA
jgi:glyoxylase-like metal-dependent hydrolase (beta-lactamase superfamily II)